ncbi:MULTISPECIES: aldehyde dehydrogenase family protein [Protofrankia]|uniref:aldehyde dehydrogenase (NAD(+)) n=1 Tax=Protofrankia coriariae TaxID=1562887 RepID=A0ABR5F6T4_9ACTN|nr:MULTISPECIES: aldehyde dehydrogenase family protein [Protofrankia]KLL12443.1 aldehyde dehydrogenase [Protofrankia coriariae]ONH31536.1 aldehyde dehydrogenase family protein [Protofrankia sp. BMG5.30]
MVVVRDELYVAGRWRRPHGQDELLVHGAANGAVIGIIPDADAVDVDDAVEAAKQAFPAWSTTPLHERLELIRHLEEALTARIDELARTITTEVGTPVRVSRLLQAEAPCRSLAHYRALLPELSLEEKIGSSVVVREPLGVVACITAWNYPLQQLLGKIGAALATGCTTVVKPSEVAPLSAFTVAEAVDEAGFPAGVFNLVTGTAESVGEPLVVHPDVDMVHVTGSTRAGRRIGALAAGTIKRLALELGGKSANVILDDADLAQAVKVGVANCFTNSGQTCTAWTRMLVPHGRLAEVEELVKARVAGYRLGDPLDPATNMGPLVSQRQQEAVRGFIRGALDEGARLVAGGPEQPEETAAGYFVKPTVFSDVTPGMTIAQEEVFGPVLAIMPFDDDDDAIRIANSTIYGLAGGVWSQDTERAGRVARRIRAGQIDINGSFFNAQAPFGGFKQSGIGRELGIHGLLEFYELKSLQYA